MTHFTEQAAQTLTERTCSAAAYGASAAAAVAGLTLNQWVSIVGALGVIATLAMNFYFKQRADRRKQIEHELAVSGALERRNAASGEADGGTDEDDEDE
jgi:hypothetical protein